MSSVPAQLHIAAIVLHDGGGLVSAEWNDQGRPLNLSAALQSQTRPPDTVIELASPRYSGAQDLSRSLRSRLLRQKPHSSQALTSGPAGVKNTPLWRTVERQLGEGFTPRYQWLWILPSGTLPAANALEELEDRVFTVTDEQTHSAVEIVGAKQLYADTAERRLINVGLQRTRTGEVITGTEPRELDQGQYDGNDAVPAVSAHGMLVHAGLFGDLGGFDPALPDDYAAAQFCARAREVGALTVVEPGAVVFRQAPPEREIVHRLGGALWLPPPQRRGQIRLRLSETSAVAWPLVWAGEWFTAMLRLLALIVCKAPDIALSQFLAAAGTLINVPGLIGMRRFRAAGQRAAGSRADRSGPRHPAHAERVRAAVAAAAPVSAADLRSQRRRDITAETVAPPTGAAPSTGDAGAAERAGAEPVTADGEFDQMPARRSEDRLGLFLVLTVLTGVSLVGFRDLLTSGALAGGAALPVSDSVSAAWHHAVSFLVADSLGERAAADPFALVLLVLSALSGGYASVVLLWTAVLAAPLSALTGWWAAGLWSTRALYRVLAGLIWGLLPGLHTAVGQGRIGSMIAHILLPVVLLAAVKAVRARTGRAPGEPRWRPAALRLAAGWETAAAAGLLLAVVTAAAPLLLLPAVAICATAPLLLGRPGRVLWLVPLPALSLFAPMLISAVDRGSGLTAVLLSEPGRVLSAELAGAAAPIWQQLLGYSQAFSASSGLPGASGTDAAVWLPSLLEGSFWSMRLALLIGGPLLCVALVALFAAGRRPAVLGSGLIALGTVIYSGLAITMTAGHAAGELVSAYPGPLVSVLALCLTVAALNALEVCRGAETPLGGLFAPVATTLLVLAIFTSGVFWAAPRMLPQAELVDQTITAVNSQSVLIQRGSTSTLPATAADQGTGPAATRTLLLSSSPAGVSAQIVADSGITLDAARTAAAAQGLPLWAGSSRTSFAREPVASVGLSGSDQRLAELIAALAATGSEEVPQLMRELGIGHILVTRGDSLMEAADTSAGLVRVADTEMGLLWRAESPEEELPAVPGASGASTSWARIVDADGEVHALLPSRHHRVDADLQALTTSDGGALTFDESQEYFVEIASERAAGWRAELNGEPLRAVTPASQNLPPEDLPWMRQFMLPGSALETSSAELTLSHRSDLQYPILLGTAIVVLLFIIVAVPLPRSWRMREVRR